MLARARAMALTQEADAEWVKALALAPLRIESGAAR